MKDIFKNKYNIFIPLFLLIVLFIAIFLYSKEYKSNRYAYTDDEDVYQYLSGSKIEYKAKIGRNKKSAILSLNTDEAKINLNSTPIYNKKDGSVIFPKEMTIVSPIEDSQYHVKVLSEIYVNNKVPYLRFKRYDSTIDKVFMYDGKNLYFFIDEVTLSINDKRIKLSPMSYISCSYNNVIEYYDKGKDKSEVISLNDEKVYIENDYMKIDVGLDKIIYKNNFTLLNKDFSTLEKIENKNID